mgnify:FL=1
MAFRISSQNRMIDVLTTQGNHAHLTMQVLRGGEHRIHEDLFRHVIRAGVRRQHAARRKQALDLLAKWDDLTGKYDCTMAQLVIALTARMIPGLHVLCGARTPEQVLDNAGALNIKLDGADAVRMKWDVDAIS